MVRIMLPNTQPSGIGRTYCCQDNAELKEEVKRLLYWGHKWVKVIVCQEPVVLITYNQEDKENK